MTAPALEQEVETVPVVHWHIGGAVYQCAVEPEPCPSCGASDVVVELPPPVRDEQVDGTTHVCLPSIGGCNQGFTK